MKVITSRPILVFLMLACLPVTAGAQTGASAYVRGLSLEDLMRIEVEPVFGASKRLQPVTEAPASVTIVTGAEIARYGHRTLADVLRSVRGFYVTNDRNYSYLGARGFARLGDFSTRILLLVDGHRMNDNIFDQAAIGPEFGLDAAMFERVEIVRGPSSSLYGTNAVFAVVNVIVRKGAEQNGATAAADAGTFGTRRAHVAVGNTLANGLDYSLSASYSGSNGPARLYIPAFDAPETNNGIAERMDGEESGQLLGRVKFANFTLTGVYGNRVKDIPTASYGSAFNQPTLQTTDQHGFVEGEYARTVKGNEVALRAYLDRLYYSGTYPRGLTEDGALQNYQDYASGMWTGAEARLSRNLPWRQTLTIGTELRDNFRQAQGATSDDSPDANFAIDRSSRAAAVYAQDEITIHRLVRANVGARYDAYAQFSRLTPRAAVILTPSARQVFKYLYGTAFRAPNAYELDYFSAGVRNESLRPETMTSHEIVWEGYTGKWLRTSASVYRNRVAQLVTLVEDPTTELNLIWANHGEARGQGLELEGEWRFKRFESLVSYAFQHTTDLETLDRVTNSPRHVAKIRFSTPGPVPGSTIAVENQYLSSRTTLAGNTVDPASIANVPFVEPLGRGIEVVAAVRNLFNTRYGDPGSEEHRQDVIEQDGRTVTVGLRWKLRSR
ncbi:MAG TPA: TonB-dependent receptor [Vicinamibacterales bacterium]|nr:TonB-dependent receptor [Vicinamibacterales bacterium]